MLLVRRVGTLGTVVILMMSVLSISKAVAKAECAPAKHAGGEWRLMPGTFDGHRNQTAEKKIGVMEAVTLAPEWTFSANDQTGIPTNEITGYPIIADGCVYVGTSTGPQTDGYAFALNADTGELVWQTKFPHGIYSTLAVANGKVYAFVSQHGNAKKKGPYVAAMDQKTGRVLWTTIVDMQSGSDAVSSPVVFDGMVWVGVSGTAAEGDEDERFVFQGNFVLLDADTGEIIKKTYTIPKKKWKKGFAGGAIWSTLAIDVETKYGYSGTGNPFNYESEHKRTNAVLKVDLDRNRRTFGEIVASYKGDVEEYFPQVGENFSCDPNDPVGAFFAGFECGRLDVDFGATANIFKGSDGRTLVGVGQKSGVYHVMDAKTMKPVWKAVVGIPSAVGGIVGSTAFDGENIYGPHTVGGYMWSLDQEGAHRWVSPFADGIHWGPPATYANGVVYSVDLKGNLVGMDAATGAQILNYPMLPETAPDSPISWGGTSVARNRVYATVGVGITSVGFNSVPGGYVIAFGTGE